MLIKALHLQEANASNAHKITSFNVKELYTNPRFDNLAIWNPVLSLEESHLLTQGAMMKH